MEQLITEVFTTTNIDFLIRLLLAILAGCLIGYERFFSGSPAGIKTHSLVCIGACLVMILSEYLVVEYNLDDITRMPAQVISGIGFLGAGTILVTGSNQVKGLTSAAGIWFSACIGLALGAGFYFGAIVSLFLELTILRFIANLHLNEKRTKIYDLHLSYNNDFNIAKFMKQLKKINCNITLIEETKLRAFNKDNEKNVIIMVSTNNDLQVILEALKNLDGIIHLSDI